jgi:Protein of unknown function (DUF3102)
MNTAAEEANKLHRKVVSSIDDAIRIGEILTEQKAKLKHGEWLPWMRDNLEFSRQTADNYRKLYDRRAEIKMPTISNLTEAYRILSGFYRDRGCWTHSSSPQGSVTDDIANGLDKEIGQGIDPDEDPQVWVDTTRADAQSKQPRPSAREAQTTRQSITQYVRRAAHDFTAIDERVPVERWTDHEVLTSTAYVQAIKNIFNRIEKRYNQLQPSLSFENNDAPDVNGIISEIGLLGEVEKEIAAFNKLNSTVEQSSTAAYEKESLTDRKEFCEVGWLLLTEERDMAVMALTTENLNWKKSAMEFFKSLRNRKIVTVS